MKLFVVEKHYATKRLKGDHKDKFKWIDERVFSENDEHLSRDGESISAKQGAQDELARLRELPLPDYIQGYRLVERTVTTKDKVIDE